MAKEDIVIGIKTQVEGDMGKTLDTLDSKVRDVTKSIDKLGDTEEKAGKQSKDAGKSFAQSVKEIASGIGVAKLAEGAFNLLKDAFMSNGEVAKFLGGVMEGVNVIFQEVVGVIVDAIKNVYEASNGFEGLTAVLKGTITLALTPLKSAFYAIKLAILEVQLLWEKSPFGSGDTKTIKELETKITETGETLKQIGKDAINAGVDIATNIGKAVTEVASVVEKSAEGIEKIDVKAAMAKGKRLKALEDGAKIAEAQAARLTAKYETQAELLRQIRDDDTKSIEERTQANNKLAEVLDQQEKSMMAGADAQVAAAKARLSVNNTIDNQVALTNALAAKDQVLADIEGKRSEQKQNEVNLRKESLSLTQLEKEAQTELSQKQRENSTARIKDDLTRLNQQKLDLEETRRIELERLQANIDSATKGTEARVQAEKEYALKKEELDNSILVKTDEINSKIAEKTKERLNKELQSTIDAEKEKASLLVAGSPARLEAERMILQTQLDYYTQHKAEIFKTDEEYAAKKKEIEKQITENQKAENEARKANTYQVITETLSGFSSLFSAIGQLDQVQTENKLKGVQKGSEAEKKILKESFERQKRLSIVTTLINGAQAIVAALSQPDPTFGILTGIRIAFATATTAIQVAAIQSKQFDAGGGGGGGGGAAPTPSGGGGGAGSVSAPSTIGLGQMNIAPQRQQPNWQKVYVVESDIRNTTNRVEVIENRSVLGS
jgi:hypothetical protein